MKKRLNFWLMAALVCGLSMSIASCKDDDKDEKEDPNGGQTEEQAEKDIADAATFWDVVGQLTDTPMPDNWQNATYEPAIGQPDGTNTAVRIVNCADAETAAARAADLLGGNITESTQDYTYQNDVVGTLTYHKTGGASLATVDVSIKQMPGLSQIIYKTPEQMGQNESFSGTAYYRFGDVVAKENKDGDLDYWVCIRPSFGPAGKGESHWISVSKLPSDYLNTQDKASANGVKRTHKLPKNLVNTQEYIVDLAEVLYAMSDPQKWAYNLIKDNGYQKLKYMYDFDFKKRYEYHDNYYFDKLGEAWEKQGLFKKVFGLSREEMKQHLNDHGLSVVYNQGSINGNDITLKVMRYDGLNLKTKHEFKSTGRWDKDDKPFDINALMTKGYIDDPLVVTGGGDRYWVVRYASGATLAKGTESGGYDKYKRLPNCYDIFLYNEIVEESDMTVETLKDTPPSNSLNGIFDERGYYLIGDVLLDKNGCRWICVQGIPTLSVKDFLNDYDKYKYAYFVSFDRDAVGDQLKNVPKKQLAMQMLFDMEIHFHDALYEWNNETNKRNMVLKNIKKYAGVAMEEIVALRDTVHFFSGPKKEFLINNDYLSTVYKDTDGKLCVLRLIGDYTKEQGPETSQPGERYFGWYFYDAYSKDLTKRMLLSDLADQNKVNTYASQDIWVTLPWGDINAPKFPATSTATTGPRADTENLTDLMRLIYVSGHSYYKGTVPFDMYRDPLVPFAVKRIKDVKEPVFAFDDNTTFFHLGRVYNMDPNGFGENYQYENTFYNMYERQSDMTWLNGKLFRWGMVNAVK